MKKTLTLLALTLPLILLAGTAQASDQWLHVRVVDQDSDGQRVSVNIPMQMIEALVPTIETRELHDGILSLDTDFGGEIDLRELFLALRDAPDADFVRVQGEDESARVAKEDGFLIVDVDERRGDRVRVRVPLDVVEAMVGEGSNELDLIAGLRALAEYEGDDLISVESDDVMIRVWIDSSETGE